MSPPKFPIADLSNLIWGGGGGGTGAWGANPIFHESTTNEDIDEIKNKVYSALFVQILSYVWQPFETK